MSSTLYERQTSFALFSAENPTSQQSGTDLDAEFNAVKVAIDDTQQNLAKIQDDDGALARGSVGREQLGASILLGFGAPTTWQPATLYTADTSTVFNANKFYIANTTHTSGGSFDVANWDLLADFTTSAIIDDGSIGTAKLADNAVQTAKLADGSVTSTKLATNAVQTAKIADAAVITQKLADANVTLPKLAPSAISSLTSTIRPGGTINLEDYGAVGDGSTDDRAAIQNAINAAAVTGATVYGSAGKTYRVAINTLVTDLGLIVKSGVTFRLNGCTINLECTGSVYGIRLQSDAHIVGPGTVATTVSVSPGSQSVWHSPISLGAAYGEVLNVALLGNYINATRWSVRGLTITNVRSGGFKIAGIGGVSHGVIEDINFPDDVTSIGCVNFDWGTVGAISSAASSMAANRTAFDAGTAYTVHPNNIEIRRLKIGNMTHPASCPIRLSGVHSIRVEEFEIAWSNAYGLFHTAGDLGYEFADSATKRSRHTGIVFRNGRITFANNGSAIYCDAYADNVAVAQTTLGYSPYLPAINPTDILFENINAVGSLTGAAADGIVCFWMEGGIFRNCSMLGFSHGARFANGTKRVRVQGGDFNSSQQEGIYIGDTTVVPEEITVEGAWCYSNGISGVFAGIYVAAGKLHIIRFNRLGAASGGDSFQDIGVKIDPSCVDVEVFGNHVLAAATAYIVGTSTSYGCVRLFRDNTFTSGIGTPYTGVNIVPIEYRISPTGALSRNLLTSRATLTTAPSIGTWQTGDTIDFIDPIAGGYAGTKCVAGGTPGTWKNYGVVSA